MGTDLWQCTLMAILYCCPTGKPGCQHHDKISWHWATSHYHILIMMSAWTALHQDQCCPDIEGAMLSDGQWNEIIAVFTLYIERLSSYAGVRQSKESLKTGSIVSPGGHLVHSGLCLTRLNHSPLFSSPMTRINLYVIGFTRLGFEPICSNLQISHSRRQTLNSFSHPH